MATSSLESRIQAVEARTLTPIVLKALQCDSGTLTDWTIEPVKVTTGVDATGSSVVYRFTGRLQTQAESLPWSLILKVLSPALVKTDNVQAQIANLEREVRFYQSGLSQQFPPGFRAADCYHLIEKENEAGQSEYWLWLEDLADKNIDFTSEADYYQFAYGLGRFNGHFLSQPPLPSTPWLRQNFVRDYVQRHEPHIELLFEQREHPLVRRAFPPAVVDDYAELWRLREEHLSALNKLPQTLGHNDALVTNLFLTTTQAGQREVVAIDWGTVDITSLGLDPAQLLWFSTNRLLFSPNFNREQLSAREQAIFAGFLAGLQAQGWDGTPKLARLGYTAALLKQRMGSVRFASIFLAETIPPRIVQRLRDAGMTREDLADNFGQQSQFFADLFQESLALRDALL